MNAPLIVADCAVTECGGEVFQRGWCSSHWHRWQRYGDPESRPTRKKMERPPCSVEGCSRPSKTKLWCSAHTERLRRSGDVQAHIPIRDGSEPLECYRSITRHGHPLADSAGRVREHRFVLYESIGSGDHPCHWCGVMVSWSKAFPFEEGALVVDHLDHQRRNNHLSNLVPSCGPCNSPRWSGK